jgi:hypothetical protein
MEILAGFVIGIVGSSIVGSLLEMKFGFCEKLLTKKIEEIKRNRIGF